MTNFDVKVLKTIDDFFMVVYEFKHIAINYRIIYKLYAYEVESLILGHIYAFQGLMK